MNEDTNEIKKVIVQISRAEKLIATNEKKTKKPIKWRVVIKNNNKKYMTDYAVCGEGHPFWNNEVEIKLSRGINDPLSLQVVDFSNNQYGQIVVPLDKITTKTERNGVTSSRLSSLQFGDLMPTRKCLNPTGVLFYRIWVVEFFTDEPEPPPVNYSKRHSIFGFKNDTKAIRKQSYALSGSQSDLTHTDSQKMPKRLSIFKSSEKHSKFNQNRSKAKSMANIHTIEDIDRSRSSESEEEQPQFLPPDDVYQQVTRNHGWVRVEDLTNDNFIMNRDSISSQEMEHAKVDLFSVQPDNGPIEGNFTVVMEGSNFTSGLYDLTYVYIDGLDPIDANTCTKIVSDTEMLLTMPSVPTPGTVNIHLELLDGSRISCVKTFHYVDYSFDSVQNSVLTPRYDNNDEAFSTIDKLFDQYDDVVPSPVTDSKQINGAIKNDSGIDSFNRYDRRKLSDYGSQGSIRSDRTSSMKKKIKKINLTKFELHVEVENLRHEVTDLKSQLTELESSTAVQMTTLQCQLESRELEIDTLSCSLCKLKMQLLEDGLTKYLELS